MRAAELFGQGRPNAEIARMLGVSDESVRRWKRVWEKGGADALRVSRRSAADGTTTADGRASCPLATAAPVAPTGLPSDHHAPQRKIIPRPRSTFATGPSTATTLRDGVRLGSLITSC
ncbi:helix-turn-helix domain-containing protein [Streptomyces sp. 8K308]|uniref:helix-turn-helix domain-containing protein n=1 Tax=Streptomyces sp. 8K308 TaxID=2530388 RepID=UPI001FB70009|nr:helix-turn-helix domain-containing protein [Streptomyces sp. 8K308]